MSATTNTKIDAARAMLADLQDEAAALSMAAEEALAYLKCGADEEGDPLAALGTLTADAKSHLDAVQVAYTAAHALLMRARDGRGSR